jgi:hypothetical protein
VFVIIDNPQNKVKMKHWTFLFNLKSVYIKWFV